MDPNQTLADLLTAVHDGEIEQAQELLDRLKDWLDGGGFKPEFSVAWSRVPSLTYPRLT